MYVRRYSRHCKTIRTTRTARGLSAFLISHKFVCRFSNYKTSMRYRASNHPHRQCNIRRINHRFNINLRVFLIQLDSSLQSCTTLAQQVPSIRFCYITIHVAVGKTADQYTTSLPFHLVAK